MSDDVAHRSRPFVAAGALFFDESERLMLVRPTYKDYWDIPGGYVEAGETPQEACAREIHEELALVVTPGRLLVADWAPSQGEGDKLLFVFDGGRLATDRLAAIRLQADELSEFRFYDLADAVHLLIPRLARRIETAVHARRAQATLYAEHGRPVATWAPRGEAI